MKQIAIRCFVILAITYPLISFTTTQTCSEYSSDCDNMETINLSRVKRMLPDDLKDMLPPEPTVVPVKRIHSRHRRFLAPGASWDLRVGVWITSTEWEFRFNLKHLYPFDYLFGGTNAFIARIVAKNASAYTERDTRIATLQGLTQLQEFQAALAAGRSAREQKKDTSNDAKKKKKGKGSGGRSKRSGGGGNVLLQTLGRRKRELGLKDEDADEDPEANINNILTRTVADDQLEILKKIEASLDKGGLPGRQCVLRTICEIKETPIHEWSLVGEMITNFILPKKDNLTALEEYRKAETIGEEHGDCWSFYPNCPFSIFNIIPDIYTKEDQVKVTFDDFSAGSETTKDGPDSQSDDGSTANRNATDADSDAYENDDALKILLKQFGGTSEDVKEVKVDLDLTKP